MNSHALTVLEYYKVRSLVGEFTSSAPGHALVEGLVPSGDPVRVSDLLRETAECLGIFAKGEQPPLEGIRDIGAAADKLFVAGALLTPLELIGVAETLAVGRRVKSFFERLIDKKTGDAAAPLLAARVAGYRPLKHLEDAVFRAIDENAEVKDGASPDLRRIRKQISRMRDEILGRMESILRDSGFQKVVQDAVITMRDDRYVLPLKPNFRQSIRGVVHGQSGSRSTLFVEPLDVLEQNNRLAELRMDERDEVERILRELTSALAAEAEQIRTTLEVLSEIDAVVAKARFGLELDGAVPVLSGQGRINLRAARHPLILWKAKSTGKPDIVVENDISFGNPDRVMILSGPNAGGKTAVLKTVGVLSLMAQAGIPIPAQEGSELPCFSSIFADIGDEQSLERDLSTFSSHVGSIAEILARADGGSLVLLDELGSGTDPAEGAGLGASVLEALIQQGSITMVTTHHNALKLFGSQTGGASNAAMEFDPATLLPTYRLIAGRPGRSYGLDMAARMGVPDKVIERARARLSQDETRLEDLLRQVEADTIRISTERDIIARERSAAERQRFEAEAALKAAREEARAIRARAKEEAGQSVKFLRRKLRELSEAKHLEQAEIRQIHSDIAQAAQKLEQEDNAPAISSLETGSFSVGDTVRIPRVTADGKVLYVRHDLLEIEINGKKISVPAREAVLTEKSGRRKSAAPGWTADIAEAEGLPDRLNLLGLRVNEAIGEVERFLDRVSMSGFGAVTIIHGLGTGALRKAVTEYLNGHPLIASMRMGGPGEGGAGVTVVELKK